MTFSTMDFITVIAIASGIVGGVYLYVVAIRKSLEDRMYELETRVTVLESSDLLSYRDFHTELEPLKKTVDAIAVKLGVIEDRRQEEK